MIDPILAKLADLHVMQRERAYCPPDLFFEVLDDMAQRIVELERKMRDQSLKLIDVSNRLHDMIQLGRTDE